MYPGSVLTNKKNKDADYRNSIINIAIHTMFLIYGTTKIKVEI